MRTVAEAHLIVISGLPGSGKSTAARALARRFARAAHVEADRLQDLIVEGAVEGGPDGLSAEAWAQVDLRLRNACLLARSFVESGFTAIVDDIVVGRRLTDLDRHLDGVPFLFVMLAPPFEHVRQRWIDASSPFADSWDWIETELRERTPRTGLWIDTSSLDPEQTADAIVAAIGPSGKVRP
jgi:predicted kinase